MYWQFISTDDIYGAWCCCLVFAVYVSIHKEFCLRQGVSSPISDLTERLLLEDKDPAATPQESLFEAPPFDEVTFLGPPCEYSLICCVLDAATRVDYVIRIHMRKACLSKTYFF